MSDNWLPLELPDGSYADDTRPFSQQDVVNYLPTFAEAQGTRSRAKYKTVPGLSHFTHVGDGPHRGARDVEGKAFIVSGRKLYQVAVDGTATEIGTIPGTGKVSMTHNQISGGNQLVIATGDNSYVYNTVTEVLAATGVPLVCVDFLNQRILGVDQARRFWRYSGVATATSWEELDNESAESSPDRIVGGIVSQGEWLVFGERTIEVFSNSPNEATAFVRSQVIEKGCANANTICRLDNSVMWVGNDGIPYRLNGYTPVPIASKAIIDTISSGNPRKLSAFTWEDKGYVCYYVTAQDGYTFGYDVSSGKWHRRESYGFDRWRINTLFKWNNAWYAGDFQNGRMYRLQWGYVYEGCEIMPRKIRTGVMHNNGNRVTLHGFRLDVATGGPASEPNCPDPPEPSFQWWLTHGSGISTADDDLYISTDATNWTATTRSPFLSLPQYIKGLGVNAVAIAQVAPGATEFEHITDMQPTGGITTTLEPLTAYLRHIRVIDDVVFFVARSGTTYWYSTDKGATRTPVTFPGALPVEDIARLDSGRWLALASGIGGGFYYSDEAIPLNWTFAAASNVGSGGHAAGYIACSGTAAVSPGNVGYMKRTTDGVTWTAVAIPVSNSDRRNGMSPAASVFLCQVGQRGSVLRSVDDGLTWAEVFLSGVLSAETIEQIESAGGLTVASVDTQVWVSSDNGATWAANSVGGINHRAAPVLVLP